MLLGNLVSLEEMFSRKLLDTKYKEFLFEMTFNAFNA